MTVIEKLREICNENPDTRVVLQTKEFEASLPRKTKYLLSKVEELSRIAHGQVIDVYNDNVFSYDCVVIKYRKEN